MIKYPFPGMGGMGEKSAVELFSSWAEMGKDEGMETGHSPSVEFMLSKAVPKLSGGFSAIDVGCGNGWAVRKLTAYEGCQSCVGVDGSESMIEKARRIDPDGKYTCQRLPDWQPESAVDLVITMEFMYYLEDPLGFLSDLNRNWLKEGGIIAIGIDHYVENPVSISWPDSLGVPMATMSIQEWLDGLEDAGFSEVEHHQAGAREDWAGTLVLLGRK